METRITLADDLYQAARAAADREGKTVSDVVAEALRRQFPEQPGPSRMPVALPVSSAGGGLMPGVRLEPKYDLWALLDDEAV